MTRRPGDKSGDRKEIGRRSRQKSRQSIQGGLLLNGKGLAKNGRNAVDERVLPGENLGEPIPAGNNLSKVPTPIPDYRSQRAGSPTDSSWSPGEVRRKEHRVQKRRIY